MRYQHKQIRHGHIPVYSMISEETGKQVGVYYYYERTGYWVGIVRHGAGTMAYSDRDRHRVEDWIVHENVEG